MCWWDVFALYNARMTPPPSPDLPASTVQTKRLNLPIGIQGFAKLREEGCYYVDKPHALRLIREGGHYFQSSAPLWQKPVSRYAERAFRGQPPAVRGAACRRTLGLDAPQPGHSHQLFGRGAAKAVPSWSSVSAIFCVSTRLNLGLTLPVNVAETDVVSSRPTCCAGPPQHRASVPWCWWTNTTNPSSTTSPTPHRHRHARGLKTCTRC